MFGATTPPKEKPKADEALWLWGRLKDFERDGAKKTCGAGKSSAMAVSRSSWISRVLRIIGQLQFARLRDVPICQPSAFLCPGDFELGLAILQIGAQPAIASARWLA